jgi:hypothetical protein
MWTRVAAGMVLVCVAALSAQALQPAPRTRAGRPPAASATVRGRVTTRDAGAPLRGVEIRVRATDGRENRLVATDADGYFVVSDLAAGEWLITASKPGFISQQHGQERPFDAPQPLVLSTGVATANFSLRRAGAIAGRVVDEFGEPLAGVKMQVLRTRIQRGRRTLTAAGVSDQTDDTGAFRIFGLPAGEYYVAGSLRLAPAENLIIDAAGSPPTYYPGVPILADAQRIVLGTGEEQGNISFAIQRVHTVRVAGRVIAASGDATGASVELTSTTDFTVAMARYGTIVAPDGSFELTDVAPGSYAIRSTYVKQGGEEMQQAYVPVTVGTTDLSDVVVVLARPAVIDGGLVADGTTTLPANLRMSVVAASTRDSHVEMGGIVPNGRRFRVRASGPSALRVEGLPETLMVKAIEIGGRDVADTMIELAGGETYDARVVLTDRITELAGRVTTGGSPAPRAQVVVFADDPAKWLYGSRFVQTARADDTGNFRVRALPAESRYVAVALDYLEEEEQWDPEFLDRLRARGSAVSIGDGERKSIDLGLITR